MTLLALRRVDQSERGTFGEIYDNNGHIVAYTCEPPDNGNKPMGCIPTGTYKVIPFISPSKGEDFMVSAVPGRTMIEIHAGNTVNDTEGCILVGDSMGTIRGMRAVLSSRFTLNNMLKSYPEGFDLIICDELGANNAA